MIEYRIKSKSTSHSSLGREIKISPKSHVEINEPGLELNYEKESVSICIGIGKDHTANLIMSLDAWEALKNQEEIHIDTIQSFRNIIIK